MRAILIDLGIDITPDIIQLIDMRNEAVHEGEIGSNPAEAYKNVRLLNELIHEIIVKLIGYKGQRRSSVLYGDKIVN